MALDPDQAAARNPFRALPIGAITPKHVYEALDQIWAKTAETASRTRGRIEAVLEFAREHDDLRPNPAAWSGWLKTKLGDPRALGKIDRKTGERVARGNHPAMPYADAPAFMTTLMAAFGVAARAIAFAILTAARWARFSGCNGPRSISTRSLDRAERTDEDGRRALRPALRAGARHPVWPVRDAEENPHVFPSPLPREPLSNMALAMTMRE